MDYIILRALHVIGIVCWFAGLFYLPRLFIYHAEANSNPEPKRGVLVTQFKHMERRLWYGIMWPAFVFSAVTGTWLIYFHPFAQSRWLHLKLIFLAFLIAYHFHAGWVRKRMADDVMPLTSHQLRIYNEIPTFLLVAIVFTVISRMASVGLWSLVGCAVFFVILVAFFLKKLQGKK